MFGISMDEATLLIFLCLVLVGPTRLPDITRKVAHTVVKLKRGWTELMGTASTTTGQILKGSGLEDLNPSQLLKDVDGQIENTFIPVPPPGAWVQSSTDQDLEKG